MTQPAGISVIVPTRNRPDHAAACLETLRRNPEPELEILLVDQSDGEATAQAVAGILEQDPRVRYLRTDTRGAGAARNHGLAQARHPLVLFTDDDCRVPPDWVQRYADRFAAEPSTALICGNVHVPGALAGSGFAATFEGLEAHPSRGFPRGLLDLGITANLGIYRTRCGQLGAFDSAFGPGTPLLAAEDTDLLFRALALGLVVRNDRSIDVAHLGVRPAGEEKRLRLGYIFSTGALLMKHARCGDGVALSLALRLLRRYGLGVLDAAVHLRRPLGVRWLWAYLAGLFTTLRYGVDRERRLLLDERGLPVVHLAAPRSILEP